MQDQQLEEKKHRIVLSHRLVRATETVTSPQSRVALMKQTIFLSARLNMVPRMVMGAAAVIMTKQMCKRSRGHQDTPAAILPYQEQSEVDKMTTWLR